MSAEIIRNKFPVLDQQETLETSAWPSQYSTGYIHDRNYVQNDSLDFLGY